MGQTLSPWLQGDEIQEQADSRSRGFLKLSDGLSAIQRKEIS